MLVLHPVMFVHIGVARGSLLMLASTGLQTIAAKLNLECTRLQFGNLQLRKNEDFETLISASRTEQSVIVNFAAKLYPIKLVLHSAITIMVCSFIADDFVSDFILGDFGKGQFLFSILPALN